MSMRITILGYILVFILTLLISCKTDKTPTNYEISRSEATNIVLHQIVSSDTIEKGVYIFPEIINKDDTVYSFSDTAHSVQYNSWFFFIDDMITARFAHPCRFVFINCESGNYEIFPESWPPTYLWEDKMEVVKEWFP